MYTNKYLGYRIGFLMKQILKPDVDRNKDYMLTKKVPQKATQ